MIKTNKKLALLLVLAMLMTMFVGAGTASAAGITYSPLNVPAYETKNAPQTEDATVLIKVSDAIVFGDKRHIATVTLPSGTEFVTPGSDVTLEVISTDPGFAEVYTDIKSSKTADLYIDATNGPFSGEVRLLLTFSGLVVKSGSGDLAVDFSAPAGSAFNFGSTEIAYIGGTGSINVQTGLVKKIGENGGYINGITISESVPGVLQEGDTITFKLGNGYSWKNTTRIVAAGGWAFDGYDGMGASTTHDFNVTTSGRDLILQIRDLPALRASAGKITIGTNELNDIYPTGVYPFIEIDDGTSYGDIKISVTSSNSNVDITSLDVANFDDFGITLRAAMTKDVLSGRTAQEISNFFIDEEISNSLKEGQTIYFELPEGVKWAGYGTIEIDGTNVISAGGYTPVAGSDGRKVKNTLLASSEKATSLAFKNMKVIIEPWFKGPLEITVSGTIDVEGKITVAEAAQPVILSVEGMTSVVVGAMNQKAGDLIITETQSGAILGKADHNQIFITLPNGVTFAQKPTVAVTSGDLDLGEVKIGSAGIGTGDNGLLIKIDDSSTKKSTIKISDIHLTLDRTVPQGVVQAKFEGSKDFTWADGSTALVDFATEESLGSAGIATTTTAAQGGAASFVIGSKTFQVGGVSQIMDVAPYIKDDRSFVPVRFLGENMLGTTVSWNEAAQEVTLTKGGIEVVLTIGSQTYTVNGAAKTADVAPQIVDSRTFLPARYVAEAFGATVGWDEGLQTVFIQR